MSVEEELRELSTVMAGQRDRLEVMEELIIDWTLLMHNCFPYTWNNSEDGVLIQERVRELGLFPKEREK